ncbi:DUF86 domain-containing protein [Marinobacter sp. M3C]|jgi:uncharacterized protein YutE (UPF0331/DUF86 family)|uniref:type VII toxin-antitoxin system HepT family RNase toxin n=1 Tax=unclassified Marinobacter TaxID=83889 RepID=UPI00201055A5|nr:MULTISPECIES: HepT-like ribonuclease domain-containing protein [unclassified Marinobacter]MCL1476869.1 DUF86 domain-containing protein [Marinobacter sp.]MCL1481679.1 DUF86 domain-containing protein [Marinobacter sp.]MCL1483514.1 DUF86 domain-containing protein [Marinobacter sp.]UQG57616.1 DUF86 domain-containing protein [Marinobacter sp. M4C]UQG61218.1 DUF86 domain-containing protein [Marinobacter sp. M3C]
MDEQLVAQKLESLRRCIQRVELKLPDNVETLLTDLDAQDIVSLNLTRAVQMSVDIASHWLAGHSESTAPKTMGQAFDALANSGVIEHDLAIRMRKSVGFRNVMVHNYDDVNWEIVFAICQYHLGDFRAFAKVFSDLIE